MYTMKERLDMDYGLTPNPQYIASRCAARKTRGSECTICSDVCPQGIYPVGKRKRPVWDQCVHCGLCAAACPNRCITPPADRVNGFLMALARRGVLTIGCDAFPHGNALSVSCVACLSWEQLAVAALKKGVVISLRGCESCGNEAGKALIDENIRCLRVFLGEARFRERVTVLRAGDPDYEPPQEVVSRRELFRFVGNMPLDKAFDMLPQLSDKKDGAFFYRAMLRDAVAQQPATEKYGWELPRFQSSCYNCGYCVKACPSDALRIIPGKEQFTVAVDAWKCTGCGICRNTCRVEGIRGIEPVKLSSLGTVALARLQNSSCTDCGSPIPRDDPNGRCGSCQSKWIAKQGQEKLRSIRGGSYEKTE